MIRIEFKMLNFLLTIEHLPTFDTEDFTIRLTLDAIESSYEGFPLGRVAFDHRYKWCLRYLNKYYNEFN